MDAEERLAILRKAQNISREESSLIENINEQSLVTRERMLVTSVASRSFISYQLAAANRALFSTKNIHNDGTDYKNGIWFKPTYYNATQKQFKNESGYQAKGVGVSLGFDHSFTRAMLGATVSYISKNVKYDDLKKGDKSKINNILFSLYGKLDITDNLFLDSIASFGLINVKKEEQDIESKITNNDSDILISEYKNRKLYSIESMLGYNFIGDNLMFTPMIGARYVHISAVKYKNLNSNSKDEASVNNVKASNALSGIFGLKLQSRQIELSENTAFIPEGHAFLDYKFTNKVGPAQILMDGGELLDSKPEDLKSKIRYAIGLSANLIYKNTNFALGYDINFNNKKYTAHKPYLKVRFNF
ncbi:hypothetical protein IHI24_000471 [Rickettsia endosymbiont of Cardiosporidium cionae]|nr:hypothetical protein IHI24_000471 [Rickettsia endosymbiont of Cardiosporidium cionae]